MIPKDLVVHVSKFFNCSASELFNTWVDPDLISQWFFAAAASTRIAISSDLRTGGRFCFAAQRQDGRTEYRGKYFEIERPLRLTFSLEAPYHFSGTTYVSLMIQPKNYGCELSLTQTGVAPDKMEANWIRMLHRLEQVLTANSADLSREVEDEAATYLCAQG